jgi:hypothetical protein
MNTLQIGSDSEFVKITLPSSYSRDEWMETQVELSVNGFNGMLKPNFEVIDFKNFLQDLKTIYETLQGRAKLFPREEQFVLTLAVGTTGHVLVTGVAWSRVAYENKLQFEFEIDQTYLVQPISQLETILSHQKMNFKNLAL